MNAHKVLGLTLRSNLEWDIKVTLMVSGASKRLHVLRVLIRCGIPSSDLLHIYFALVRSVLEYYCPIWSTTFPVVLSDKIKSVQTRALTTALLPFSYPS